MKFTIITIRDENLVTLYSLDEKVNKIGKYSLIYIYGNDADVSCNLCRNMKYRIRFFFFTDDESNEGSNPYDIVKNILKNVVIVSCYFSSENPRKLHYKRPPNVSTFCEKLFDLSSVLPVDSCQDPSTAGNFRLKEAAVCFSRSVILPSLKNFQIL